MDEDYTSWIGFPKASKEYVRGINAFLENAFPIFAKGEEMKCPCRECENRSWHLKNVIFDHLICNGPSPLQLKWICEISHTKAEGISDEDDLAGMGFVDDLAGMDFEDNLGEMFNCTGKKFRDLENDYEDLTNAEARKFYRHVREGKQPLYPGCTKFSRLSFMIKLYHIKCGHGISESAFGELLDLIKDAFPDAHLPSSFTATKNIIKNLGLDYQKIHACPNNCMLYWAENTNKEKCELAEDNKAHRESVTDPHTLGPDSMALLKNNLKKSNPQLASPSDAAVYIESCEREEGRTYKTNIAELKKRFSEIKKKIAAGEDVDELIANGKSHGPEWLKGRQGKKARLASSSAPTDPFLDDLTAKIRGELEVELEAKLNRKVQKNMSTLLQKLAEANPGLNLDLGDFCATMSSEDDENATLLTGGSTL